MLCNLSHLLLFCFEGGRCPEVILKLIEAHQTWMRKQPMCVSHCVGNLLNRTCFKSGIWAHCERHSSSGQWSLTISRTGIWFSIWKFKTLHICIHVLLYLFNFLIHPSIQFQITFTYLSQLLSINFVTVGSSQDLLKQKDSSSYNYTMESISTYKWLIINMLA